jgi:hypothetical protein
MTRISTYTQVASVDGTQKLVATDVKTGNATSNVTVEQLVNYIRETEPSDLDLVGINLKWSNDPTWRYESSRVWSNASLNVKVPYLWMEFENLVMEPDTTYEVVLERSTPKRKKGAEQPGYKKGGFKMENPTTTTAPYNVRPVSLPISTPTGDLYDFKFDWYYRQEFPLLSGYKTPGDFVPHSTRLPIAFRIKKTDSAGEVTYSHSIRKINLVGGNAGTNEAGIGFSEL